MNAWAEQATAGLSNLEALHDRTAALHTFSASIFPRVVQQLPVLYMFSGADLLTAHALFPSSPEYHLVADFPVGHPSCFLDAACISQANESAIAFFQHWAKLKYARQSTNLMRRAFDRVGHLPVLLVSLRLMNQQLLHLTTRHVQPPSMVAVSSKPMVSARSLISGRGRRLKMVAVGSGSVVLPSITLHTERARISYHSMLLRSDPSEHVRLSKQDWPVFKRWERGGPYVEAQLEALSAAINRNPQPDDWLARTEDPAEQVTERATGEPTGQTSPGGSVGASRQPRGQLVVQAGARTSPRLMVSMFKAAPHWILRNRWMANWVLRHSAATLHDESGLRPLYYNVSAGLVTRDWQLVTRGIFADFENREVKWYPGEKAELKEVFRGPDLPFQFGYAQHGGLGVLLAAWRKDMA